MWIEETSLKTNFLYSGNKVIYSICKTCCIMSLLFSIKCHICHKSVFFCLTNTHIFHKPCAQSCISISSSVHDVSLAWIGKYLVTHTYVNRLFHLQKKTTWNFIQESPLCTYMMWSTLAFKKWNQILILLWSKGRLKFHADKVMRPFNILHFPCNYITFIM